MNELIKILVETPGPSGHEGRVRELVQAEIEPLVDDLQVDALGNLIARQGTVQEGGCKVMLAAHMDEIGVMVTHVDERGFARFTNIGGVYSRHLYGGRVRFLSGLQGVIGAERSAGASQAPPLEKLFIDVGATGKGNSPLKVGDVAAFERPFLDLGNRLVAKAMDDRIGVAVLIETLKALKKTPHQVFFVFSVQEEVGTRGATTAAYGVNPDVGLAVDVTGSGDTPLGLKMDVSLGKGPAVKVRDGGMLADARVVDWLVNSAEAARLPYQMEVLLGGTTDARAMQISRSGVLTGALSIPSRYIHSPSEMVDLQDVKNAVRLLVGALGRPLDAG